MFKHATMFLRPLEFFFHGLYDFCQFFESKIENSMPHWDSSATHLIGLKEGQVGSDQGILMCHLINSTCKMFNTCDMDNHNITWLLNLGKNQNNTGECYCLLGAVKSIGKLFASCFDAQHASICC